MESHTTLTTEEVIRIVNRVVVEEFEAEEDRLRPETHLREDLDMDSLDGVDLVVALEVAFEFRIAEEEARGIRTLGDVYERVQRRIDTL